MFNNRPFRDRAAHAASRPRFRQVNWRQEYLHVAIVLMSACFLAPWMSLTVNYFVDMSLAACLGLTIAHLMTGTLLVRVMIHRRATDGLILSVILLLMWIAAALTILLAPSFARAYGSRDQLTLADLFDVNDYTEIPGGPILIGWAAYLWWRAYQLGTVYTTLVRASFSMRLGIVALLWVVLFGDQTLREGVLSLVPFFFFFGLLASSLARADSLSLDQPRHRQLFGRGWFATLLVLALLMTLGGFAASLWLIGINMEPIARGLILLLQVITALIALLATPILIVVQLLYDTLLAILPDRFQGQPYRPGQYTNRPINQPQLPWLADVFQIISTAVMVGIILFIIATIIAFLWFLIIARARPKEIEDEERESLGTGEVVGNLRQSLRDNWRRLAEMLGILRRFGLGRDLFVALTIRRIYARMEALAGSRGYPRAMSETPYEYRPSLHQAYPGQADDFLLITEAYVAVRYGDVPEDPADLDAVRAAWIRLHDSPDPAG